MKVKFLIIDQNGKIKKRFDTEAEAVVYCEKGPSKDLLGNVEWHIRKIWTNARE